MVSLSVVCSFQFSRTAERRGRTKTRRGCGGLRKFFWLSHSRNPPARPTRLAGLIDHTIAVQRAVFGAGCRFSMAFFANIGADNSETAPVCQRRDWETRRAIHAHRVSFTLVFF